ncbi:MAG: hypothetical protein ERJ68_02815, partial [Aphanocapsa feldmannii 277cI]
MRCRAPQGSAAGKPQQCCRGLCRKPPAGHGIPHIGGPRRRLTADTGHLPLGLPSPHTPRAGQQAPPGCSAAQFGGRGDRRALEEALAAADGVLVGAETIRRHGTSCLIQQPDLLAGRHDAGLPPQPPVVVASRSGWLPPTLPFFHQPLSRWLLCPTQPTCGPGRGFVRVLRGEADQAGLVSLGAAGLQRLVVLGGARLAASLLAADLIDAIQLTICPR